MIKTVARLMSTGGQHKNTISPEEVQKFSSIANEWWDPVGKFKLLHRMNPPRVTFMKNNIHHLTSTNLSLEKYLPFKGLRVLDVGCGGGILSSSLARLGGEITGIDASSENISVARVHALKSGLSVDFQARTTAEMLEEEDGELFDVVCAMEVVEHVSDLESFVDQSCQLLKPGGMIFLSTINKTQLSYLSTILMAEKVLRIVPDGTHDWNKYVEVEKCEQLLTQHGIELKQLKGLFLDPWGKWWLHDRPPMNDLLINYIVAGVKR